MPKIKNSNETFWMIFKQCEAGRFWKVEKNSKKNHTKISSNFENKIEIFGRKNLWILLIFGAKIEIFENKVIFQLPVIGCVIENQIVPIYI